MDEGTGEAMRKFRVWLDVQVAGKDPEEEILEFPNDATEEQIREACSECLDTMIANELDTGWDEILPKGSAKP
jgi:hypothetical protein